MCREKQEAEPGFPEIKPDDCPMLGKLSQMTAAAFLKLDFDGDEEVEMNRQQCYEMLMDMYNADMNRQAIGILNTVFTHFGCESILSELAILESCSCFHKIHDAFMRRFLFCDEFIPFILTFK
ncbi:hypothetical protein [Hornefia butyriciproducens]|uniref:hypothetical protein n=1 Tax=Hornefia butyriciproducens TaxID=2652293 RepID=UPI003F897BEA